LTRLLLVRTKCDLVGHYHVSVENSDYHDFIFTYTFSLRDNRDMININSRRQLFTSYACTLSSSLGGEGKCLEEQCKMYPEICPPKYRSIFVHDVQQLPSNDIPSLANNQKYIQNKPLLLSAGTEMNIFMNNKYSYNANEKQTSSYFCCTSIMRIY